MSTICDPTTPEQYEEYKRFSSILTKIHSILSENEKITTIYKVHKVLNAVVLERMVVRDIKEDVFDTINTVSILQGLSEKYPLEISKDEYNKGYSILIDKSKFRKYIIEKLLK